MVRIPDTIFQQMINHAFREVPFECCGILVGKGRTVDRIYEMKNADGSTTSYSMLAEDQLEVSKGIGKERLEND